MSVTLKVTLKDSGRVILCNSRDEARRALSAVLDEAREHGDSRLGWQIAGVEAVR